MLLAVCSLAALGPAQEPAAPAMLLRVVSNQGRWVEPFAERLGVTVPVLAEGQQVELVLTAGRPATARVAESPFLRRTLVVEVRAAAWLDRAAAAVREAERDITVRAEGFAKLCGLPGAGVRSLCRQAFDVARSLDSVVAVVTQVGQGRDYDVRLEFVPLTDSAFAAWLGTIAPAAGAPARLPWTDAAVRLAFALQPDSFAATCEPFLGIVSAFAANRDAEAAQAEARALLPLLDGSFHACLRPGRLGLVYGLRDADAFAARANDPQRLRRQQEDLASQRIEAEYTPAAATYRGVPLLLSRVRSQTPVPALADADGWVVAFGARVGSLWLQVGGGEQPQDSMKSAIDDALAGRLRGPSTASPDGAERAWLTCEVDLVRLGAIAASTTDAAADTGDAPSRLQMSLSCSPHTLKALIQLR